MTEPERTPPVSGEGEIDAAVADLAMLEDLPLEQHHDVLAQTHDALHRALTTEAGDRPGPAAPKGASPTDRA